MAESVPCVLVSKGRIEPKHCDVLLLRETEIEGEFGRIGIGWLEGLDWLDEEVERDILLV